MLCVRTPELALEAGDQTLVRKGDLSGCGKGLKTVPLAQALLSLKPAQTTTSQCDPFCCVVTYTRIMSKFLAGLQANCGQVEAVELQSG